MYNFIQNNQGKISFKLFICSLVFILVALLGIYFFLPSVNTKIVQKDSKFLQVEIPDKYNSPLIFNYLKNKLSVQPVNAQASNKIQQSENQVRYSNAYQNTDVVQTKYEDKLKEDIILKSADHPKEFAYKINSSDYLLEIDNSGDVLFKSKNKQDFFELDKINKGYYEGYLKNDYQDGRPVIFKIPAPFMIDSNGKKSSVQDVKVEIQDDKLILKPNLNWLSNHKYPIVLDPTVESVEEPEKDKVEIGGVDSEIFKPELKLYKWDDEAYLKIWKEEVGDAQASVNNGKIIWQNQDGSQEYNFYALTEQESGIKDGAFEYEIILKEKPISNVIELKIDLNNLECYYQPELTQEEIDDGVFRPENVVGSYACYHSTQFGDYTTQGGKNYQAGKAFHIYRPQIQDDRGNKVWGELKINKELGIYSVTIPQKFLDNAHYPIRHATGATFGRTTVGASGDGQAANEITCGKYNIPVDGEVSKITYYIENATGSAGVVCGMYDHSGAVPSTFKGGTTETTISTATWYDFTYSAVVKLSAGYYALCSYGEENHTPYFDTGVSGDGIEITDSGLQTYSTWPSPWDEDHDQDKEKIYTVYATYAPLDITYGTRVQFKSESRYINVKEIGSDKFVVTGHNADSTGPIARVGSVSDITITYGDQYALSAEGNGSGVFVGLSKLNTNKFSVSHTENLQDGLTATSTVSTVTITRGNYTTFESGDTEWIDANEIDTDKWVIVYNDESDTDTGKAIVCDSTGDNISCGSPTEYNSGTDYYAKWNTVTELNTNKYIACWEAEDDGDGYCVVGTVSGTTIVHGTPEKFTTNNPNFLNIDSIDTDQFILSFYDVTDTSVKVIAGTVDGTDITFGTEATIDSDAANGSDSVGVSFINTTSFVVAYGDGGDTYGKSSVGFINWGTLTVTSGTSEVFNTNNVDSVKVDLIDTDKVVICFREIGMSNRGSCVVGNVVANNPPKVSSVVDTPDSIGIGSQLRFSVDWSDVDSDEMIKAVICKGSGITTSTAQCKDGEWTRSDVYTNRDPEDQLTYTTQSGDIGTQNYWAFVCDDSGDATTGCSAGTAGTFTVANQRPDAPISMLVEGMEIGDAINITDTTPEFSAIYKDENDEGDIAEKYCIEVDTQSDFTGTDMWIADSNSCYTGVDVVGSGDSWWNTDWGYRRPIIFNNATSSTDLNNFPVLVQLHEEPGNIDYGNTQDSGEDIRFINYDGTALDYEIEKWNETATSSVWVEIPSIEGSTSTQYFYMYYGNDSVADASTTTGVWDEDFKIVQHLQEGDLTDADFYKDSTRNTNHAQLVDSNGDTNAAAGKVDGALDFGGEDYVNAGDDSSLDLTNAVTLSAWVNIDSDDAVSCIAGRHHIDGYNDYGWRFVRVGASDDVNWRISTNGTDWNGGDTAANTWLINTDYYITATYDNSNMRVYINGVEETGGDFPVELSGNINQTAATFKIGAEGTATPRYFANGVIDEVRMSTAKRSDDWIAAEYWSVVTLDSASTTDDYLSYGEEETNPYGSYGVNTRLPKQTYDGTALTTNGTTYYWRAWFWDGDERSATSTTGWFTMADTSSGGGVNLKGGARLKGGVRLK